MNFIYMTNNDQEIINKMELKHLISKPILLGKIVVLKI